MKRILLSLLTSGLVIFGLAGPFQLGPQTAKAADGEKPITFDIAIDCRTFRNNLGLPFSDFGRGDGFIANGKIFPAGTLLAGAQSNDPNNSGSIGTYIEHGTFAATLAEIGAGKRPAFVATWFHLLDEGGGIVTAGPHPDSGPMAVIGGMGGFIGASGEQLVNIIGTNVTGCPNMRVTFHLLKVAPK